MKSKDLVLSYLRSFESADPELIVKHLSEEFENNQMGLIGKGCKGRAVYQQRLVGFLAQFRNLRYTVDDIIEIGDRVATAYTMYAEDNDKPVEIRGIMFFSIEKNLITRRSDCWDGLSYLQQMGIDSWGVEH